MSNKNQDGAHNKLEIIEQDNGSPSNPPGHPPASSGVDPQSQAPDKEGDQPKPQIAVPSMPVSAAQAKSLLAKVCGKIPFLNKSKCLKQCLGIEETDPIAKLESFIHEVNETMKTIEKLKASDKTDVSEQENRKVEINTDNKQNT
jgi:hypothetical protein